MSVRDLIDAIASGDSQATQQAFETEMMSRVSVRMDAMKQEVAQNMFKFDQVVEEEVEVQVEEVELDEATGQPKAPKENELHVQHVGGGKYKVHAVGKNFSDGIKAGEHLSDTELDDFSEMGGKIKHVK